MRRLLPLTALLLATTACGGGREERTSEDLRTMDVQEAPTSVDMSASAPEMMPASPPPPPVSSRSANSNMSPPAIGPSAAPGVAFNYRYAFRLPGERISAVQEQHAAACEKLGLDRCRITGMRYRLLGEDDVEAFLAFKLDPAIARQFGKNGIEAVTQAQGMLVDSEISGFDAGSEIQRSTRNEASLEEELRRIEGQLARQGLRSSERAELQMQADQIRQSIRANQATREERRESLAKTPMVFHYGSGDVAPGFDDRTEIATALEQAWENVVSGMAGLLLVLITLLPWAVIIAFLIWLLKRFGAPARRFFNPQPPEEQYQPAQ